MNTQAASDLLCGLLDFINGIPPAGSRRSLITARESWIFEDDLPVRNLRLDEQTINHANRVTRKSRPVIT